MLAFDSQGRVIAPGRYADRSRHFDASAGVLPSSMTVGTIDGVTNTPDTGVTSSFIGGVAAPLATVRAALTAGNIVPVADGFTAKVGDYLDLATSAGAIIDAGRLVTAVSSTPGAGTVTLGGATFDAAVGQLLQFGHIPALQIISGTQAGSTRRASLYASKIDLTKVSAVHMKAVVTGGGGSNRAPRMGLLNNPTGSSTSGFILNQVGGVNTCRVTTVDSGGSTNVDLSYPWGAPPARHELHVWLTCSDRMLYFGSGEQDFDWSKTFVGDMDLGIVVPHLAIQSAVGGNATMQVHEFRVTPYFW